MFSPVKSIITFNRKITFDYNIDQRIECGIVLKGTEVKALRTQSCSIEGAYCIINNNTFNIYNMTIGPYKKCFNNNHDPHRQKILLCQKKIIKKLQGGTKQHHWEFIPEKVIFTDKNLVKVIVAVGKKAKLIDKREQIKAKELRKEIQELNKFYK